MLYVVEWTPAPMILQFPYRFIFCGPSLSRAVGCIMGRHRAFPPDIYIYIVPDLPRALAVFVTTGCTTVVAMRRTATTVSTCNYKGFAADPARSL